MLNRRREVKDGWGCKKKEFQSKEEAEDLLGSLVNFKTCTN